MSAKANHAAQSSKALAPVIVFGIDGHGKPKAARFGKDHANLAIKAADQLQLRVLAGDHPKIADLFGRLPVGRVHATGRTFVPFVRRDLYDKLVAIAAPNGNGHHASAPAGSGAGGAAGQAGGKPPASPPNLPRTWAEIGIGDLVVAQESADDGWYAAIVAEANGDMLTLRWRDFPRERRVVRHRDRLGLLHPVAPSSTEPNKPSKPVAAISKRTSTRSLTSSSGPSPATWEEIDIGHLVLAMTDSPWGTWCEAMPIAKNGDELTLRWRDNYANVAPITRQRFELVLISPTTS